MRSTSRLCNQKLCCSTDPWPDGQVRELQRDGFESACRGRQSVPDARICGRASGNRPGWWRRYKGWRASCEWVSTTYANLVAGVVRAKH